MYKSLQEPCKSAIKEERCLGCNKLEDEKFEGDKECEYGIIKNNKRKK